MSCSMPIVVDIDFTQTLLLGKHGISYDGKRVQSQSIHVWQGLCARV